MFVNVFTYSAKPGQEDALLAHVEAWDRERRPKVHGFLGGEVYRDLADRRHFINIARFESREAAQAVANEPEQDTWYRTQCGPHQTFAPDSARDRSEQAGSQCRHAAR